MTDDAVARIVTAIAKYEAQKIGLPANQKSIAFFSSLVDRAKILPMCQFLRDSPSRNPDQVVARFVAFFDDSSWLIEEEDSDPQPSLTTQGEPSEQSPRLAPYYHLRLRPHQHRLVITLYPLNQNRSLSRNSKSSQRGYRLSLQQVSQSRNYPLPLRRVQPGCLTCQNKGGLYL